MAARKTSALPTRIWKFGARFASREDEARAREILFRSNRYYNTLIEIERDRSTRFVAIRQRHAPELAAAVDTWNALDEQIIAIYRETKDARQRHFRENNGEKKRILPTDAQARVDTIKRLQKSVSAEASVHRKRFSDLLSPGQAEYKRRTNERCAGQGPTIKGRINAEVLKEMLEEDTWHIMWKEIARSDDDAHRAQISARAGCRLATGTYQGVEEAFDRAKKDSLPRPPGFHRFNGEGRIGSQTKGSTYKDIVAGIPKFSLRQAPHDPTKKTVDQSRIMIARLDQSIPRGDRQDITITCKVHRAPPPDAEVKWVRFVIRRVGERTTVELQLTLEHASFAEPKRPAGGRATEHIKIGWARVDGGIRVAHWPGSDVVVPDSILSQHGHAISIGSAADIHFERAKKLLRRVMRTGPHRLTAWHRILSDRARKQLREACTGYAEYVLGADGARQMWRTWVAQRKTNGKDLYAMPSEMRKWFEMSAEKVFAFWCLLWAKKDAHLMQYAVDSERRFGNRRDAFFRSEAIRIATEFAELTVDNYDIAALKKLDPITMPGEMPRDKAQHQLQEAAPGRFREILNEVMGGRCTPCERSGDDKKPGGARRAEKEAQNEGKEGDRERTEDVVEEGAREDDEEAAE